MTDQKPQRLPSDALKGPTRRVPWIISGVAALGIAVAAAIAGPSIAANLNPAPTPTPTLNAYVSPPLTPAELAVVQQGADEQQKIIAADEKAVADAAAAQAAADAAKSASYGSSESGPIRCPAGSSANSNDGVNDTSCFPDICFHIPIPDPAHPECDTAFKP